MAVTLYRCSKCRGLFNTVFEPLKMCRDCKLGQTSGGTSRASLATLSELRDDDSEIAIIEPEEDSMGGGGKSASQAAIGGPIGDAQNRYAQGQQNAASMQGLMGMAGQGIFSGGSEIRSPLSYEDYDVVPGTVLRYDDGTTGVVGSVRRLDNTRLMMVDTLGRVTLRDIPPPNPYDVRPLYVRPSVDPRTGTPSEPESSPHDAILKPSRKLKLAAE